MLTLTDPAAQLLTTREAAEAAQVSPGAIRMWRLRGHLEPAERDARGWPLYRLVDVARAEHATRKHARRTHPSAV